MLDILKEGSLHQTHAQCRVFTTIKEQVFTKYLVLSEKYSSGYVVSWEGRINHVSLPKDTKKLVFAMWI